VARKCCAGASSHVIICRFKDKERHFSIARKGAGDIGVWRSELTNEKFERIATGSAT